MFTYITKCHCWAMESKPASIKVSAGHFLMADNILIYWPNVLMNPL